MFSRTSLGQRLDMVRSAHKLTQSELCELLGVSRTSLQLYVKGERDIPVSALATLFEKYSIDPVWMMYGDEGEELFKRKTEALAQIRSIGMALEDRAEERGISLSKEDRWRILSQLYTTALLENTKASFEKVVSPIFIDTTLENSGHG